MPGEIDVSKLTGTIQAFAKAADTNGDGKVDTTEVSVFYDYLNNADPEFKSLWKDFTKQAADSIYPNDGRLSAGIATFDSEAEWEEVKKKVNAQYAERFGNKAIDVQEYEDMTNREVIKCYRMIKDTEYKNKLDELISSRPDLVKFDSADKYIEALDKWATDAHKIVNELDLPETKYSEDNE